MHTPPEQQLDRSIIDDLIRLAPHFYLGLFGNNHFFDLHTNRRRMQHTTIQRRTVDDVKVVHMTDIVFMRVFGKVPMSLDMHKVSHGHIEIILPLNLLEGAFDIHYNVGSYKRSGCPDHMYLYFYTRFSECGGCVRYGVELKLAQVTGIGTPDLNMDLFFTNHFRGAYFLKYKNFFIKRSFTDLGKQIRTEVTYGERADP
jgi:hypothetical protein